jgi:Arc/MetJ family transcription regulator
MKPPLYLVGRGGGLERGVCDHLGIELDLRRTDDGDEAWGWLRDELDAGRPTMVNADIQELDYLRVQLSNTMHDIVVTGYDPDDGVALIADNDREEIQRCSLDSLARARGSQGFPGPSRHATWVMRFPERLPEPREAVDRALRQAIANMRDQGEALASIGSGSGLDHIASFAESYGRWPELFGERLEGALRGLWVFIVKAGTGGAMFRSLQAEFLRESAELLDDDAIADAARVYTELTGEWLALADTVRAGDHDAGRPHVEAIARLEAAGVAAMVRSTSP